MLTAVDLHVPTLAPRTFREQFEAECPIRHVPASPLRRGDVASWAWRQDAPVGPWYGGFPTREAAFTDAVHAMLHRAQRRAEADRYHALLMLAWTLPLPAKHLAEWEADFRPVRHVTPQLPDPRRAPQQAIKWGMDPELARTAKARRAVVAYTNDDKPGRLNYGDSWLYRLGMRQGGDARNKATCALDDRDFEPASRLMMDLSRVCRAIRDNGLAVAYGLAPEGEN